MGRLSGKTIMVTGASRGIGRALSIELGAEGATVILLSRSERELRAVSDEIDGESMVTPADVREHSEVREAVERAADRYGMIDGLVNNAGVGLLTLAGESKPVHEITEEEWSAVIDTNMSGVFRCSREVLETMYAGSEGHIVNISSRFGRSAAAGWAPLVSSKWGLEGFTRALAIEAEPYNVMVNAIYPPGRVKTEYWNHLPAEEYQTLYPTDVLNEGIIRLLSANSDAITGQSHEFEVWQEKLDDSGESAQRT